MGKRLEQCKTGRELVNYAKHKGCEVRNCKSSHVVVSKSDYGAMTIPVHGNKQLGPGLLRAIVRWFVAAGLSVLGGAIYYVAAVYGSLP